MNIIEILQRYYSNIKMSSKVNHNNLMVMYQLYYCNVYVILQGIFKYFNTFAL